MFEMLVMVDSANLKHKSWVFPLESLVPPFHHDLFNTAIQFNLWGI